MVHAEERLALIECFERDGRAGRTVDVHAWPLTLGRARANSAASSTVVSTRSATSRWPATQTSVTASRPTTCTRCDTGS